MTALSPARRAACAAAALTIALVLFRGQLADAVVTRGDDAFRSGDVPTALRMYDRALRIDPHSRVAADRLAFYLALRHDRTDAGAAVAVATRALRSETHDSALFADRAFADLELQRWTDAEHDFAQAGALAHDARYDHFASRMALRAGDRTSARIYALRSLRDDAAFTPARALLRSLP